MKKVQEVEARREAVLQEIRSIRSMKRGTLNEQYLKVHRKGLQEPALRGPYYVLSRSEGTKTVSERLRTPLQIQQAKRDIAAHKRFVQLCKEFEVLTEQLGVLSRQEVDTVEKKRLKRS